MRFGNPALLWLLIFTVPLVLFLMWSMRRRAALLARFATDKVLRKGHFLRSALVQWLRLVLFTLAFVMLVLALARPQWGFHERQVITQGVDMVIAIDTSASMMARDFPPTRLNRAKELLKNLIWEAKGSRVGIVAFAGSASVMCPLTLDYNMAITALKAVDMNTVAARGTDIGSAISAANGVFEISGANDRVLILLTDGEQLERQQELESAVAKAKEGGVHIFAIGLGGATGSTIPTMRGPLRDSEGNVVETKLDFELLQKIADQTGGEAIRAEKIGASEIAQISNELQKFRGRKQQDKTFRVYHERYPLFLAAALLFLVAEALLRGSRRFGRMVENSTAEKAAVALLAVLMFAASGSTAFAYPGEVFVRSRDALQKYHAGSYEDAAKEYEAAKAVDPQNPELTFNLGAAAAKAGKTSEAKTLLSTVYDPDRPQLNIAARYGVATLTHRELRKEIADRRKQWQTDLAAGKPEAKTEVQGFIDQLKKVADEYKQVLLQKPGDNDVKVNFELAKRDIAELEKLIKDNEQKQQQQQQQQQQQKNDEKKEDQKQGGQQPQQQDDKQKGESGKDDKQKQDEQKQKEKDEQAKQDEQNKQKSQQQNKGEENQNKAGDQNKEQSPENKNDNEQKNQQKPGEQGTPTPTPAAPKGTPQATPGATASPSPSPMGSPTPGTGEQGGAGTGKNEPIPIGEMSKNDVERLLNTLPAENQQALQLLMGTPTEQPQDMKHEW